MTSPSILLLAKCLRLTGGTDESSLMSRISVQKRIYLLQEMGLDLGYKYVWDAHGPYSSEVAKDFSCYAENETAIDECVRDLQLTSRAENIFYQSNILFDNPADIDLVDWLELLASIRFISNSRSATKNIPEDKKVEVAAELIALKPKYKSETENVKKAIKKLDEAKL